MDQIVRMESLEKRERLHESLGRRYSFTGRIPYPAMSLDYRLYLLYYHRI